MRGALQVGLLGSALLGSALLGASPARAAEVEAQGPSECPDSAELGFRVERQVGVPLAEAPPVRFVVAMGRSGSRYTARLTTVNGSPELDERKERVLSGASCAELADMLVVAMTLSLGAARDDATEAGAGEQRALEAPADDAPEPSAAPRAPLAQAVSAERARPTREADPDEAIGLQPSLSLAALVDVGSLPEPALGAALGAALSWKRVQLRALGTFLFEQHTELAGEPAPGADLRLLAGSLLGCSTSVTNGGFSMPVCLGFEVGVLSGVGTNVASPRSGSAPWAAARADIGALWRAPQGSLWLGAMLTGAGPITRSRFELTGIGTVYRPPSVVGRLSLEIGVGFD